MAKQEFTFNTGLFKSKMSVSDTKKKEVSNAHEDEAQDKRHNNPGRTKGVETTSVTFRMPVELFDKYDKLSKAYKRPRTTLFIEALTKAIEGIDTNIKEQNIF